MKILKAMREWVFGSHFARLYLFKDTATHRGDMITAAKNMHVNRCYRHSTKRRFHKPIVCGSFLDSMLQLLPGKKPADQAFLLESELQELTSLTSYGARATDNQRESIKLKVQNHTSSSCCLYSFTALNLISSHQHLWPTSLLKRKYGNKLSFASLG
jgi:hypothetical protein